MPRTTEKPVRVPYDSHGTRDEGAFEEKHPAYATLEVSRIDGTFGPMFGSVLPSHYGAIEFRLTMDATRVHSLGEDRVHNAGGRQLFAIRMTHAQFVEIMATMNRASGVPVTLIRAHTPEGFVVFPDIEWPDGSDGTEAGAALQSIDAAAKKLRREFSNVAERVGKVLDEGKVTQKLRAAVLKEINEAGRTAGDSIPFYLGQVREAGQKVVAAARTEVDAVVSTVVRRLGFQKLAELHSAGQIEEKSTKKIEER